MTLKAKDIAKKLCMSTATVSLVLNNKPGVSEDTRNRVFQEIKDMGFDANIYQKYTSRTEKNIRIIVYKKHGRVVGDTPFFSELLEGCEIEARRNNCNLLINYINAGESFENIKNIIGNNVDGLIILATEMQTEDLELFSSLLIPYVLLDNYFEETITDSVVINNVQGAYVATKYLIDCGHKEIGHLKSSTHINNFIERDDGFRKALKNNHIKYNREYVIELDSNIESAYDEMIKYLDTKPTLPTALFADNDLIAIGALKALKDSGISVPEQVSIVGFDDMPFCKIVEPALSTIYVPKQRMGIQAAKRLIEAIEIKPEENIKVEICTKLIERDSVTKIKEE